MNSSNNTEKKTENKKEVQKYTGSVFQFFPIQDAHKHAPVKQVNPFYYKTPKPQSINPKDAEFAYIRAKFGSGLQ